MNQRRWSVSRQDWRWLGLILGIGLVLRMGALLGFEHAPESDETAYRSMALNIADGKGIVDRMGNRAFYNVGYPLLVLAPVFHVLGENLLAVRLVNVLLGAASIVLCYLVAAEVGAGRAGRLLAAMIWAVYLPASVYGVYLFKENLMLPLMLAAVWCAMRASSRPTPTLALASGAVFGLLALTGNAALSLVPVVLVSLLWAPTDPGVRLRFAATALVVAVAVCAPWMARNARVVGAPVLNTNGGFNLYLGNNPAATGMFVPILSTPRGSTWEDLRQSGELQASVTLRDEALAWIKSHPLQTLELSLRKAGYFWALPVHAGKGESSAVERLARALWTVEFVLMTVAAASTLLIRSLRNRRTAMLWLGLGLYTLVHMVFYVIYRYREPVMPLVAILAALAIEAGMARVGVHTWRGGRTSTVA